MNVLKQIPAKYRRYVYDAFGLVFAALYAKGIITDQDVANWKDMAGVLVLALARFNVQED